MSAFRIIWQSPTMRSLAAAACCFAGAQICTMAFLVTALVVEGGYSVAAAGGLLVVVQVGGLIGRIGWGWLADRTGNGPAILLSLGVAMAVVCAGLAAALASGHGLALAAASLAAGLTVVGWNGVYLAQVARMTDPFQLPAATGGAIFASFVGVMILPVVFVHFYHAVDSYRLSFLFIAVICLLGAFFVARATSATRSP